MGGIPECGRLTCLSDVSQGLVTAVSPLSHQFLVSSRRFLSSVAWASDPFISRISDRVPTSFSQVSRRCLTGSLPWFSKVYHRFLTGRMLLKAREFRVSGANTGVFGIFGGTKSFLRRRHHPITCQRRQSL